MRTEYKRDMNHNYLILYGEQEIDTASYQVRMLAGNVLPSILKCRIQRLDGEMMFYYEITSRQSIASLYEEKKFKMEDLQLIFGGFVQALEEMGEYLLNPGQLVIDPDHVFMDVERKRLFFCYFPGYEKEVQEQFRAFTEYILPKLDHEDGRAVMLGYGVYRSALEDGFHLEHIKKELYQVREEIPAGLSGRDDTMPQEKEAASYPDIRPADSIRNREPETYNEKDHAEKIRKSDGMWEENDDKNHFNTEDTQNLKKRLGVLLAVIATVAAMLGMLAANYLGYLPWLSVELAMGISLSVLGCGLFACFIFRQKKAREQKNWRKEVQKNRKARERQEAILGKKDEPDFPVSTEIEKEECIAAALEKKDSKAENFGETIVLSANVMSGPASLVSREPGELATIYLTGELTVIGKLETACDAVIPLPTVSRVHGKIRKRGEEYYLTDLNSRNGTSVNGRMLKGDEEYVLQDEDEVDFAQARYVFLK